MARAADLQEAFEIPLPEGGGLVLDSCRRLLGPNLFATETGAVGDGLASGVAPEGLLADWSGRLGDLLAALGWSAPHLIGRTFDGGASLFLAAPEDRLFTATFAVEAAWHYLASDRLGVAPVPMAQMLADLAALQRAEASPALLRLLGQAGARGVDRLLDDDLLTLGHGAGAATWATDALPSEPDWALLHDVPLAMVTGTNGKTTTVRLIAAMGAEAGLVAGLSSTEAVAVGGQVLDKGDYSGPAGARMLLRDPRLQLGVLEVARGGILRRGLPVGHARAAVVTNVAADHLGHYGILTVPDLARVKLAVRRSLAPGGALILNAGDPELVAAARAEGVTGAVWFGRDLAAPDLAHARGAGRTCGWLEGGVLWLQDGQGARALIAAKDVPLTLGGAALYNVENALAAALAARALGLPDAAIRAVLARFQSDAKDNPGRANEFRVKGARVFVDFAHNPHSIAAVTSALAAVPAKRRFVLMAHAGDRSDEDIRGLAQGAAALRPDGVVVAEMAKYARGRPPGQVQAILADAARKAGVPEVVLAPGPAAGAREILARLQPGDLALLLVHDERQAIFDLLTAAAGQGTGAVS